MKKKFLSLLTVILILSLFALAFIACQKYGEDNDNNDTDEATPTYTHTVSNGTFYNASASSSSSDSTIFDTVSGWSQMSAGTTTANSEKTGIVNAAITLDESTFSDLADKYFRVYEDAEGTELSNKFSMSYPGLDPKTPYVKVTDKNGEIVYNADGTAQETLEDHNVYAIANTKNVGSLYSTSSSFTLDKDSYYLLQFSVCSKIDAAEGDTTKGAWFRLTGDMNYQIGAINTNGAWKTYYLFIETNKYSSMSLTAQIWLGYGPAVTTDDTYKNDGKDKYATRGIAFFDNVLCEKVDLDKLSTVITDADLATYGDTYSGEAIDPDNFASFKAGIVSTADAAGNKYVSAKSAYYLSNMDMSLRSNITSYGTSYRKYFYTFRERNASNNLQKYSLTSSGTLDTKYYGIVDLAKLYDITDKEDTSDYQDNYTKATSLGGIGTSAGFNAMSYTEWYNNLMNYGNADGKRKVTQEEETYALMIYNRDLMANTIKTSEKIKVEPNTYYEISVWAYVWAKSYERDNATHYYGEYSATTKPSNPYDNSFTKVNKQIYDLLLEGNATAGSAFNGYLTMSEEDTNKAKEYAAALTAMGDLLYENAGNTEKANEAKWLRGILYNNEDSTEDVTALSEKFYYAYLINNEDQLPDAYKTEAVQNAIATLYQYERKNNIETYNGLVEKMDKYGSELDTYNQAKADYEKKYANWESVNEIPAATVKLTGAGDLGEEKTTVLGQWEQITFYVQGSQLSQRQLTLEMSLGTGSDETTYMIGGAFFDNFTIKEYDEMPAALENETWVKISEIKDADQMKYGDVAVGSNEEAQSNWEGTTATGTAASDKEKVKVEVVKAEDLGSVAFGANEYDLYTVSMENEIPTASILDYTGENEIAIYPNKFYRFAFLLKTEGVDEKLGVSVKLMYRAADEEKMTSKNTTVTEYTSEDWSEIVYYIQGDLKDVYYVGIQVTMGSGTRYSSDSYVKGKVYVAAFNCLSIDYEEYNSAATGDKIVSGVSLYNISTALDSASNKFNNAYYAELDYSETKPEEFDDDGQLVGIGTTEHWTVDSIISNSYDAPESVTLNTNDKSLSWKKVEAVTGENTKAEATSYEIWMKYTDDDNKVQEKLYTIVDGNQESYSLENDNGGWDNVRLTYFAVKAVGADGVSVLSSYTAASLGNVAGTDVPEAQAPQNNLKQSEAKAGAVLASEVFDATAVVNGVDFVSAYPTLMKLTSNYNSVLSIYSETLSSGLSADSYYKISVWAKTVGDTKASITLGSTSGALQAGNELGYVLINTADEWKEYCFFIKTGNFTTKMNVKYSIGNPYAVPKLGGDSKEKYYSADDLSQGTVYFDAVTITAITADDFDNAKELDTNKEEGVSYASANHSIVYTQIPYYIFIMEYVMDSFDASESANSSSTTANETKGNSPSNYNHGYDSDLESDGMYSMYGVYDVTSEEEEMITAIKQLYKYNDTTTKEDVFVYNDIFAQTLGETPYDWESMGDDEWKAFLNTFLHIDRKDENSVKTNDGGDNVLVMSNKKNSGYAQNYALDSTYNYSAKAGTFTKITFSARTLIARVITTTTTADDGTTNNTYTYALDKAFGELRVTPSSSKDDTVSVKINSRVYGNENNFCDDVTYTVYLYNPTGDAQTITWKFFLGDEEAEEGKETAFSQYLVGLMAIDLISVEDVTDDWNAEAFETAMNGAQSIDGTSYFYQYTEEKTDNKTDDKTDEKDKEEEKESFWDRLFKNEYFWLYISSFVIALAILVTVVVVLIRKWKKKHPREVVVENVAKTEKDIKVIPTETQVKEDALEADDYVDEIKINYVQRVNKNKSRKDRKNGKK